MGFNHRHKTAFVHIPKNAGQSVRRALGEWELGGNHLTALELKQHNPRLWSEYKTFAIIRNPWDRMVSLYHYSRLHNSYRFEQKAYNVGFEEWLISIYHNHEFDDEIVHGKKWMQFATQNQLQWIQDKDSNVIVDNIIMFEDLSKGWKEMFNIPLGIENKTNHQIYKSFYTDYSSQLVEDAFSEDIEFFNYRFENGKEKNKD